MHCGMNAKKVILDYYKYVNSPNILRSLQMKSRHPTQKHRLWNIKNKTGHRDSEGFSIISHVRTG